MKYLFQVVQTQITIPYCRILRTLDNRIGNIFFLSNSDTNYCNVLQILSAVQQITKIFEVLKLAISNLNIYIGAIRFFSQQQHQHKHGFRRRHGFRQQIVVIPSFHVTMVNVFILPMFAMVQSIVLMVVTKIIVTRQVGSFIPSVPVVMLTILLGIVNFKKCS